jgi:hypothetical protein
MDKADMTAGATYWLVLVLNDLTGCSCDNFPVARMQTERPQAERIRSIAANDV